MCRGYKQSGWTWISQILQDIYFGLRMLCKNPGFTAVAVLSLGIGIGANATALCWVQSFIRHPLPGVKHQEQIVVLTSNQGSGGVSLPDIRDMDDLKNVFTDVAASQITPATLSIDNKTDWIYGQTVTANFFDLLDIRPVAGRAFFPDEDRRPGGDTVLVISENFWQGRFNRDPAVIGKTVNVNHHSFTIIGVAPKEFMGTMTGLACDFWAPISMYNVVSSVQADINFRKSRGFHDLARLQPGVSLEKARKAVSALDGSLALAYPDTNREIVHRVLPISECPWGAQTLMGPALHLLLGVTLCVLLIVTANIATLLLARAVDRQREMAIRIVSGAGRWRLIRQLLTESVMISLLGGAGGVLLAVWMATNAMSSFLPRTSLPIGMNLDLDASVLGLTLLLTVASGLVFGLWPAIQGSRMNLDNALKDGSRSSTGGAVHNRLHNALVIAEVAITLVLLIVAGLCLKGLQNAHKIDVGFDSNHVLIAGLQLGMNGYTEETGKSFYNRLQQRLAALPGVEEAAFASWFPLGLVGCKGLGVDVPGYSRSWRENPDYKYTIVSPRYFRAMKIPIVAGREFNDSDDTNAMPVAIVNENFAKRFWPDLDPIGRIFRTAGKMRKVVGVAKAGKYKRLDEDSFCMFYLPYRQYVPDLDLNICLRAEGDPELMIETVRKEVHRLDASVELWGAMPLTAHCESVFFAQRIALHLLMLLCVVALALATMGVYGVMSYAVNRRMQEFGIRMALGATRRHVLHDAIGRGLKPSIIGIVVGLVLASSVTRLLAAFLYGVNPYDPLIFFSISLFLIFVVLAACWLPARRAAKVDPMEVLRWE